MGVAHRVRNVAAVVQVVLRGVSAAAEPNGDRSHDARCIMSQPYRLHRCAGSLASWASSGGVAKSCRGNMLVERWRVPGQLHVCGGGVKLARCTWVK